MIEEEILRLTKEYSDLEEIWKAEKSAVLGSAQIKEEIDHLKADITRLQREGKLDKVAELQYGKLPQLEAQLKAADAVDGAEKPKNQLLRTQVGAEEIVVIAPSTSGRVAKTGQSAADCPVHGDHQSGFLH